MSKQSLHVAALEETEMVYWPLHTECLATVSLRIVVQFLAIEKSADLTPLTKNERL